MTSTRIKMVALSKFAENGYDGASLADIANEVGIKKQSIYTHFKGKDELFLDVFNDVLTKELQFVMYYFATRKNDSLEESLYGFLMQYKERCEQHDNTKFLLRVAFFPPVHLQSEVREYSTEYLNKLEKSLIPLVDKAKTDGRVSASVSSERAVAAFTAVLDGMFVEMLFGSATRLLNRIDASWFIYWRGVKIDKEGF